LHCIECPPSSYVVAQNDTSQTCRTTGLNCVNVDAGIEITETGIGKFTSAFPALLPTFHSIVSVDVTCVFAIPRPLIMKLAAAWQCIIENDYVRLTGMLLLMLQLLLLW